MQNYVGAAIVGKGGCVCVYVCSINALGRGALERQAKRCCDLNLPLRHHTIFVLSSPPPPLLRASLPLFFFHLIVAITAQLPSSS